MLLICKRGAMSLVATYYRSIWYSEFTTGNRINDIPFRLWVTEKWKWSRENSARTSRR